MWVEKRGTVWLTAFLLAALLPLGTVAASVASAQDGGTSGSRANAAGSTKAPPAVAVQGRADGAHRRITIELRNVPLADALLAIAQRGGVGIVQGDEVAADTSTVSVHLVDVTVEKAFDLVLKGTPYVAREKAGVVVIVPAPKRAAADTTEGGTIYGRVVDSATAHPLAGVVVTVMETAIAATTNDSGYFVIQRAGATGLQTVVMRHIGYRLAKKIVPIPPFPASVRVDVALVMGMTRLQEVVVTATGRQRRMELGNDITILNADSIVRTQPVTSVTDILEGRVPGLVVQRTSGAPGDPARLRLRGTSSPFMSNDPIVIVDGVRIYAAQSDSRNANLAASAAGVGFATPSPLDYLDPHNIETVEVMKGPSAAALYGSDAANGVIVITTKRGQAGPPRWTANIERGITYMPGRYPTAYLRFGHLPWNSTPMFCPLPAQDVGQSCVADSLVHFQALNDPKLTVLGRGERTALGLDVAGGSDVVQYSLDGNYAEDLGLMRLPDLEAERYRVSHSGVNPPGWMERPERLTQWGATSRLTAKMGTTADVSLTAMLTRTTQQRSTLENQLSYLMGTYVDGSTGTYYRASGLDFVTSGQLLNDFYRRATDEATQFTSAVNVNWQPRSWLTASANGGLNVDQRDDAFLLPRGAEQGLDSAGLASAARGNTEMSTLNLQATATAPLPRGFHFQVAAGANYVDQQNDDLSLLASNLAPGGSTVGGAGKLLSGSEQRQEQATFGWYIEPSIRHSRFWLSTGLRLDGGNAFGTHVTLIGLPKLSLSYLVSDEPFFPFKNIFNTFRLRGAYGQAGVQPGPGERLRLFSVPTQTWADSQFVDAITLTTLGNTKLRPERSTEFEGGFDADLLNDRVSLSVTGYRKTRVDALMPVPLPPSVYGGYQSITRNVGVIRNAGYELQLSTQPVRRDALTWSTQISVSQNRNVVVKLGRGVQPFGFPDAGVVPGYPLFSRWGRPIIGYNDRNGDGVLEPGEILYGDSLVYLGSSEPNYTASLFTTLSLFHGALAVSAGFTYADGLAQQNTTLPGLVVVSRGFNDPAAPFGEQAAALSLLAPGERGSFLSTQTVSELRFNSFAVNYDLPAQIARRLGTRALTVALQGTNLGLFTNYRGKDPNVNSQATGNGLSDAGTLPQPRTWQVRVRASY